MAELKELTPEEEARVREILDFFNIPDEEDPFSPMEKQFQQEMTELSSLFALPEEDTEERGEEAEGEGEPGISERKGLSSFLDRMNDAVRRKRGETEVEEESLELPAAEQPEIGGATDDLSDLLTTGDDFPAPEESTLEESPLEESPPGPELDTGDLSGFDEISFDQETPPPAPLEDFPAFDETAGALDDPLASANDLEVPTDEADPFASLLEPDTTEQTPAGMDELFPAGEEPASGGGTDDWLNDLTAPMGTGEEGGGLPEALSFPGSDDLDADMGGGVSSISQPDLGSDSFASELDDLGGQQVDDFTGGSSFSSSAAPSTDVETIAPPSDAFLDTGDLADMSEQARMESGFGGELSDEELAAIRTGINEYPPGIKKAILDAIVHEKIPESDQRQLIKLIADRAEVGMIVSFLEKRLGYHLDTRKSDVRKDGTQIIYADNLSPDAIAGKKRRARLVLGAFAAGLIVIISIFAGLYLYQRFSIKGMYEQGLDELRAAALSEGQERMDHKDQAEKLFNEAMLREWSYNLQYLNRYGIAYMKAGFYDDAFGKLFGKVEPDYSWDDPAQRAPLLRLSPGSRWAGLKGLSTGEQSRVIDRDGIQRTVVLPGAYVVSRIRDGKFDRATLLSLGRFHSNTAPGFIRRGEGKSYKNDDLAIDYYRVILTLMDRPNDTEAMAGIGHVYYGKKEFGAAAREYSKILDIDPTDVSGHAGILNTYIEIWKKEKDPRFVIQRHRLIRKLGLEEELPIHVLAKLAGFYIDLNPDELRIQYQVDPVDSISGLNIEQNAIYILETLFKKKEYRDGDLVEGSRYGAGFYQRGRYLFSRKEYARALQQFQNAHHYDDRNYLAISAMGEYYMKTLDFDRAQQYFQEALNTHKKYRDTYGLYPEDEELEEGDHARIIYDLGSLLYLRYAGVDPLSRKGYPDSRIYPDRAVRAESSDMETRRERLREAAELFRKALNEDLQNSDEKLVSFYRAGWVDYINGDFESALRQWEELSSIYDYNYDDPALLMGRGNSFYYTDQLRSALGSYLKAATDYDHKTMHIKTPNPEDPVQRKLFEAMAAIHNNIGAVYEKEYRELKQSGGSQKALNTMEQEALRNYWKAVEIAHKLNMDNEIARTNLQLAFKPDSLESGREPLLDDWVPPLLDMELKKDL